MRAAAIPASETSKAMPGGGSSRIDLRLSNITGFLTFDERHLIDLAQGGDTEAQFLHCRFAQEGHTLFARRPLDLRRRPPVQNHFADLVREVQQFVDGRTSAEPGE